MSVKEAIEAWASVPESDREILGRYYLEARRETTQVGRSWFPSRALYIAKERLERERAKVEFILPDVGYLSRDGKPAILFYAEDLRGDLLRPEVEAAIKARTGLTVSIFFDIQVLFEEYQGVAGVQGLKACHIQVR